MLCQNIIFCVTQFPARQREKERLMEAMANDELDDDFDGDDDDLVRSTGGGGTEEAKLNGLENLDVGSKFKMFEKGSDPDLDRETSAPSDR
jgi:hypothetical protein